MITALCLIVGLSYYGISISKGFYAHLNSDDNGIYFSKRVNNNNEQASTSRNINGNSMLRVPNSEPREFSFPLENTALVMIDFQRDFLLPGGFGELLGNNVTNLQSAIEPAKQMLNLARNIGMKVVHTLESHLEDLSDCPETKKRINANYSIGDHGPMGRILIRHEYGNGIISELSPTYKSPSYIYAGNGVGYL